MTGCERRLVLGGMVALAGCSRPEAGRAGASPSGSGSADGPPADGLAARAGRLVARYPDHLAGVEGDTLLWADGTRMPIGLGQPERPFEAMLRSASIADQLRQTYLPGPLRHPPPTGHSPGRLRNTAFFLKMYGDCRRGEVAPRLRSVAWMPRSGGQSVALTTINQVAARLERVIAALEDLPDRFKAWLVPSAGSSVCRAVADTGLPSVHAFGAAIDIAARYSDYWVWARSRGDLVHRNRIPPEIVACFEAEHFIWGGKWYHYDTMHFEYRPELFA